MDALPDPQIPDHDLLRRIGRGGYGEVWLARSVLGVLRAVKVVHRQDETHCRPFEREFEGLQRYEPISRTHPGLIAVLHIGRNERAGYFYYIMELADDLCGARSSDPATYAPKTLRAVLKGEGRLRFTECLCIGLSLASALQYLHEHGLVHRDIKPSNIVFVNSTPKLADIGLVTRASECSSYVGTPGYIPPEGPGSPVADIYSLGRVLYEVFTGLPCDRFPVMPTWWAEPVETLARQRVRETLLRAGEEQPAQRLKSAQELHGQLAALVNLTQGSARTRAAAETVEAPTQTDSRRWQAHSDPERAGRKKLVIAYKSNTEPDGYVLELLHDGLIGEGYSVFIDRHLTIGVEWAREIETQIREADAIIVLLSAASVKSEMVAYEIETAHEAFQQRGRPILLPIRVAYPGPLTEPLARVLNPVQQSVWRSGQDDQRIVREVLNALQAPPAAPASPGVRFKLEPVGGAVPLDSSFYLARPADEEFRAAVARHDSIVLVKGARQMGKTSLLSRGLQQAREAGTKVLLTDFQTLNAAHLASAEALYLTLAEWIVNQLDLDIAPQDGWNPRSGPNINFQQFIRRRVLEPLGCPLAWGLDEVDRLFSTAFGSEVFGLFRSWHNARALDPAGPWSRLTLVIAYATEAHLFITDINQSPFNVGTRLMLEDFTTEQVAELNRRYGSPLRTNAELAGFHQLVGGHPYLVRRGLHELVSQPMSLTAFVTQADREEGIFGDHLRRILVLLAKNRDLLAMVRGILRGQVCPSLDGFYRLRTAGIVAGDSLEQARPRCQLYRTYLQRHLP